MLSVSSVCYVYMCNMANFTGGSELLKSPENRIGGWVVCWAH